MSNIKEVIINPNKPADVKFVQYDTGQKLYVKNSPDFDFTNTTEIQITDGTVSASYNGEFLRQQVGTYQHTQTAAKYALGTQS